MHPEPNDSAQVSGRSRLTLRPHSPGLLPPCERGPSYAACQAAKVSLPAVAPIFFDPHVCSPPSTADLIGREMDFPLRLRSVATGALLRGGRRSPGAVVDPRVACSRAIGRDK